MGNFVKKITSIVSVLRDTKIRWGNYGNCEILIYDKNGADDFDPYLKDFNVSKLAVRGEEIYIIYLLKSLPSKSFWIHPMRTYAENIIRASNPKIVLTHVDNNPDFYKISKRFTEIKTVMVQNGLRDCVADKFSLEVGKAENYVDHIFVHGSAIGEYMKQLVQGSVYVCGSLRNNKVDISTTFIPNTVLFISQITPSSQPLEFLTLIDGQNVTWENFFEAERLLLPLIYEWCNMSGFQLKICARTDNELEEKFYGDHIPGGDWDFLIKKGDAASYELVDQAEIVISIDSTLGLESMARGKKTAFFSCRNCSVRDWPAFFWPATMTSQGSFWTRSISNTEVTRVLDFLSKVKEKEWRELSNDYSELLMQRDFQNTQFQTIINASMSK
jgi:surface carbohydrate biosynthesis protein